MFVADEAAIAKLVDDVPMGTVVYVQPEEKASKAANGDVASLLVNIAPLPASSTTGGGGGEEMHMERYGLGGPMFGASVLGYGGGGGLGMGAGVGGGMVGSAGGMASGVNNNMNAAAQRSDYGYHPGPMMPGGTALKPTPIAGNVNPTMNINYMPQNEGVNGWSQQMSGGGVQVLNLLDQPLGGDAGAYHMLQGIPFDAFAGAFRLFSPFSSWVASLLT